ncbi:MAG: alpha-N-arabinofuranosidase [Clostridia bacterium]|nr:alpha-N-arabinofuranosidase [Clostridia bacterium]
MSASIHVDARRPGTAISRNIYGHFSEHLGRCIYGGLFVGKDSPIPNVNGMRSDVVDALKKLEVPVLRWPGGCFADEYHWRDGIGPQEQRRRMVNTNWGGVVEDNSFGTHEFLELCRQIGCAPYINANVGSGNVREMAEWVEYLNSDGDSTVARERWANGSREPFHVKFWGVGNESWGCGGNMRPEFYADLYKQYQTFCRTYGRDRLYRIACGPSGDDTRWTEVLMERAGKHLDALTMHYYTVPGPWENKGSATGFTKEAYDITIEKANRIEAILESHLAVMDRFDPDHRVGLIIDEWGTWYDVEPGTNPGFLYQQNTMRDAMVAALSLNIFNAHADRLVMANIAQMVNVLQAVILTDGEKMLLTPTYHVFDLFRPHMDANLLGTAVFADTMANGVRQVSASASVKDGTVTVTAANLDSERETELVLNVEGMETAAVEGRILTGAPDAHNDFGSEHTVEPAPFTAFRRTERGLVLTLPACSVAALTFRA